MAKSAIVRLETGAKSLLSLELLFFYALIHNHGQIPAHRVHRRDEPLRRRIVADK